MYFALKAIADKFIPTITGWTQQPVWPAITRAGFVVGTPAKRRLVSKKRKTLAFIKIYIAPFALTGVVVGQMTFWTFFSCKFERTLAIARVLVPVPVRPEYTAVF